MEKSSDVNDTQKTWIIQPFLSKELARTVLSVIFSLFFLSSAIGSIQNATLASIGDTESLLYALNWIRWIAALFFGLGWLTTHVIEVALLKKQLTIAKILFIVLLIEAISGYSFEQEIFTRWWSAIPELVFSGSFLRYSTFSDMAFSTLKKILYGEKIEPST